INNNVLHPLMLDRSQDGDQEPLVTVGGMYVVHLWRDVEKALFEGNSVLFRDGHADVHVFETKGWPQRAIEDPQVEASLKGAHQGFVETSSQNIALIRRYIPNRELKIKEITIGERGKVTLSVLYLADVAHPEVLTELEDRVRQVDVDAVLNTGELEEFIEDNPYSPFPQFLSTERPDAVTSQLMQGRIALVMDRSPSVLVGPATFSSFFQSVDDYSIRWQVASFLRMLRLSAFFVAIVLPALYISMISYNYEVMPLQLILSVGESRATVAFPPVIEAFIMELSLEMLREAGVRLPSPIGQTVGIVGAIVIGQATVQAGLVSNIMVIVVALTGLASFIIPSFDMSAAIRLLRFPMMIMAALFGIVGLVIGLMTLFAHLIALESLGTPYFSPIAPMRFSDWKDTFVRLPLWKMVRRPVSTRPTQKRRQGSNHPRGDGR
ncbi:MAG: spore germination protein, partial [Tumebacillaceae bacterium]